MGKLVVMLVVVVMGASACFGGSSATPSGAGQSVAHADRGVLSITIEIAPGSMDTTNGQVSPALPVQNAELALTRAGAAKSVVVSTDSAGHFRVVLLAGEYVVRYVRPGDHATWRVRVTAGTTLTRTLQEHVL